MANTMTLISSVTVGSGGASSIDFTSIPSTYTDLQVVCSLRSARTTYIDFGAMRFNSDSGSNYVAKYLYGDGASVTSGNNGNSTQLEIPQGVVGNGATSNTFGNLQIYIPNYTGSNQKSVSFDSVTENNATNAVALLQAGRWTGTSAISSMTIYSANGFNFLQYSTAYLYGISKS